MENTNISIISIPDSDTSTAGPLNETFSPPKRTSVVLLPVTPKREADTTLNTTFTPEDKKAQHREAAQPTTTTTLNDTFSPVKEPVLTNTDIQTPKKRLPEAAVTDVVGFNSPAPHSAVPKICVVPPSTEKRTLRRSGRTPAKSVEPMISRASLRRSTRQPQTPLKTVPEKKKGRKPKKDILKEQDPQNAPVDEEEETEKEIPDIQLTENIPQKSPIKETVPVVAEVSVAPPEQLATGILEDSLDTPVEVKEEVQTEVQLASQFTSTTASLSENVAAETEPSFLDDDVFDQLDDEAAEHKKPKEASPEKIQAPMVASPVLLKSIRKRSMSVTDVNPKTAKRNFRVQFHSPGNMERTITEIDESLYLNFTKSFASSFSIPAPVADKAAKGQPMRRKRSLSNAETPVDKLATLQLFADKNSSVSGKGATATGSVSKKVPTPSPRKKMPNFAAIHANIFQQMPSLVDYKERQKERSQFLLTATPTLAANKSDTATAAQAKIVKPVGRGAIGKTNVTSMKKPASNLLRPKHRTIGKKPVSTGVVSLSEKKLTAILQTTDFVLPVATDTKADFTDLARSAPIGNVVESVEAKAAVVKQPEETKENLVAQKSESKLKPPRVYNTTDTAKPKPLATTTTSMTGLKNHTRTPAKTKETPAKATTSVGVKAEVKPTVSAYKIVKGVRMNRRFELMMRHRNNKAADKN